MTMASMTGTACVGFHWWKNAWERSITSPAVDRFLLEIKKLPNPSHSPHLKLSEVGSVTEGDWREK